MIQRIQTVYLVLGAVVLAAGWFVGNVVGAPAASLPWFVPAAATLTGLAAACGLVAVFLYGDRKRQRSVVLLAQLLAVAAAGAVFLGQYLTGSLPRAEGAGLASTLLVAPPLLAYLMYRLARRGIEKDIKLVRSMDRLR
jgi:hypothetical protein